VWQEFIKGRRFTGLLVILLVLLAGPPIFIGMGLSAVWFDGLLSVLMVAAIVSLCFEPQQRLFALLLGIPSVVLSLVSHVTTGAISQSALLMGHFCEALFFFGSAVLIVKSLFGPAGLSSDSILGAICGYLFLGVGWAVIYLIFPAYFQWASMMLPTWLRWSGVVVGVLCSLLMYGTLSSLGKNLTDTVVTRAEAKLVTHGPYRWVRHPFYVTAALLMASVTLLTANWLIGVSSLAVLGLLAIRTPKEEQMLIQRFGQQYRDYMAKTGRFIPWTSR
jgi:protein-S-isoprenylcysteine O-methyltransferase Ste14